MNKFVRFIHNAVAGNKLAMRLAFLPFIWMPMIVGVFLKENLENRLLHYCLFAVLYLIGFTTKSCYGISDFVDAKYYNDIII